MTKSASVKGRITPVRGLILLFLYLEENFKNPFTNKNDHDIVTAMLMIIIIVIKLERLVAMAGIKKYSRKREAVLDVLRGTTSHPTADWIYEKVKKEIPEISLGTVYRNLAVFKEEGLIISVGVVDGQERFDADISEHTHFVCTSCGDVIDISSVLDPTLNETIARDNDVDIDFRQLNFYGKCGNCRDKSIANQKK